MQGCARRLLLARKSNLIGRRWLMLLLVLPLRLLLVLPLRLLLVLPLNRHGQANVFVK
jgi:hypothetical protein